MTRVRSAAKINLTLDILSRREDGYHCLQSVAHAIGLWDEMSFEWNVPAYFRCNVAALENEENLCVRAVRAWFDQAQRNGFCGADGRDVGITLEKRIPSGSGLGGGSGNAAAVLMTLRQRYDCGAHWVPDAALLAIAGRLGADVPLFLRGGAVLMQGIGERLTALPPLEGWILVVRGRQSVSTPQCYRAWDELQRPSARATGALLKTWHTLGATGEDVSLRASTCSGLEARRAHLRAIGRRLHNDLQAAAQHLGVPVEMALQQLREVGALGAAMSGSGSAVFGIFATEDEAHQAGAKLRRALTPHGQWRQWMAPLCRHGVEFALPSGP